MRNLLKATVFVAALGAALPAIASGNEGCGDAPRSQWMTKQAVAAKVAAMGYKVRRVKVDDGCYEVYGIDRQGARVEIYLNPVSGKVVRQKIDD